MRQILQSLSSGETELADVPCPVVQPGHLLIRTSRTVISAGTERMLVDFGKANLVQKALQQPERVKMVLDKVRTDGLLPTLQAVRTKLDQPLPLGYSNAGRVVEVGRGVTGFSVGDGVVSNGRHAEMVAVPANLCARIPDGVDDDAAAFTVVAAIALQGIRLVQPTLGETLVVSGLGLIGLLTVQLLRASGCRVIGLDFDPARLDLARSLGAETVDLSAGADPVRAAEALTLGRGVDGVLITASTRSSEPVHQAALMCRKRGRIVLVGVTGLELSRADFYEKELTFQVSCSYGPGRYDPAYEQKGLDYPIGFVRWTEQRNFEAVLAMMAEGRLDVRPLVSHRFELAEARRAYEIVGGAEPSLGVVLTYPAEEEVPNGTLRRKTTVLAAQPAGAPRRADAAIGVIGSGNYAGGVLIPAFEKAGARLQTVASSAGVTGLHAGRKFGFAETTTDIDAVFAAPDVDAVVVSTRHDSHADLVLRALAAGKHVFVEKPLALTLGEVDAIEQAHAVARTPAGATPVLMVGYNRRFAPQIVRMKALLESSGAPKAMVMTVNAGAIPASHWTQDREVGGGRIIGEACHFIDLLRALAGAPVVTQHMAPMASECGDTVTLTLGFADGSIGTVHYFANGTKAVAKERLEVFTAGRILQLDNFRRLDGHGWSGFKAIKLWRQDKGQEACVAAFLKAIAGEAQPPIPAAEIFEVARVSITLAAAAA